MLESSGLNYWSAVMLFKVQKLQATCCSRTAWYNLFRAVKGAMGFLQCWHYQEYWEKETEEGEKEEKEIGIGQESQTGVKKFKNG